VGALLKKYSTAYWSSCPCSWVEEVSNLLESINKKYGIAKNDTGLVCGFPVNKEKGKEFTEKNKVYNAKHKPKVWIDQFKEKYGMLRVYFSCSDPKSQKEIDRMVDTCEVKLVRKLKYPYPIYICPKCKQEAIGWVEDKKNNKQCKYCHEILKRVGKITTENALKTSKNKTKKIPKTNP
jgi:hypothetical protein